MTGVRIEVFDPEMQRHDWPDQHAVPRIGDKLWIDMLAQLEVTDVTWVFNRQWPTRVVIRTKLCFPPDDPGPFWWLRWLRR